MPSKKVEGAIRGALAAPEIALAALDRLDCADDLSAFIRAAWHVIEPAEEYIHNWHVDALSEHLMASATGEIPRLLINIPPGTMKSSATSVFFPAWLWGPADKAHYRIIGASYEQGLATRDNRRTRLLIESEWYQSRWGVPITSDQNEKTYFENEMRGFRQSSAVGSMTGRRGHVVIWDDPINPKKAHSALERETAIRSFTETLPSRVVDPENSAIIIVMQRLHEDDVSGYILQNDFGYEHLCLPMEFEPERRCVTGIGFADPRNEEGELLFPKRFSRSVVDRDKKVMGSYAAAGQFQQRPAPIGGGIFRDEWWVIMKDIPRTVYRTIYADTAMATGKEHDYSVFQCWGQTDSGQIVLLDQIRGKWEAPELRVQARAFWQKHRAIVGAGHLRAMKVEKAASGTGLVQELAREGIPIVGINRRRDKISRAHDASPSIEAGNVILPAEAPWLSDFMGEVSAFPNGAHDDQVDPMMDAVTDMAMLDVAPQVRAL